MIGAQNLTKLNLAETIEIGHQNLTKLHIAAEIETARAKRAERCELTADWVVDEWRKIAGANMALT